MENMLKTVNELKSMFPQHAVNSLMKIHRDVLHTIGNTNYDMVLPSCIERILELPECDRIVVDNSDEESGNDNAEYRNRNIQFSTPSRPVGSLFSGNVQFNDGTFSPLGQKVQFPLTGINSKSNDSRKRRLIYTHHTAKKYIHLKPSSLDSVMNKNVLFQPKNLKSDLVTDILSGGRRVEMATQQIVSVIKDVDSKYLEKLINSQPMEMPLLDLVNVVIQHLLDNGSYPRVVKYQPTAIPIESNLSSATSLSPVIWDYRSRAVILLQNNFPYVPTKALRKIFLLNKHHYTSSYQHVQRMLNEIKCGEKRVCETMIQMFLKGRRAKIHNAFFGDELENELQQMNNEAKALVEQDDRQFAQEVNTLQYEEEGQGIECGCCYGDMAFENMVQCSEGHLFCKECLQRYAKEAAFGEGKARLYCMSSDGCPGSFSMSEVRKVLSEVEFLKYSERVQEEDILDANLKNLLSCPGCGFTAQMPEDDKVFRCLNDACRKETCRHCKEEWKDHFGLRCEEVEKKSVAKVRTSYEERMTQAKVRKCKRCGASFLKSSGCNKMTCRCGSRMCYICREPQVHYNHFCQHPKDPGKQCGKCKKCSLWTDSTEDDDRAVKELEKESEEERRKLNERLQH